MSDVKVPGYKASEIIDDLHKTFSTFTDAERQTQLKKMNGIFEIRITNDAKEEAVWTIDLKDTGTVHKGTLSVKPDVTVIVPDDVFADIASGKTNGQRAFITGKLKTRGNMMLATKLDPLLKLRPSTPKAKL